ncbi:hypothetical protein FHS57_006254 [Runella defluvii]|uniref:Alpha-L-arabinofuranosidase B catalytic domain-containing protein n=1 Tax=Runella defluvii TaxID=370973 RepID=A0A7W5ZRB9_9BACT|nr:hypothetical protein [Runella defluvii]MBB3842223.1 hypothetical protein [Runella defluvii]
MLLRTGIIASSGAKSQLILDTLATMGVTPAFAISSRKLREGYNGPAFTAYNLTNSAVATVAFFNGIEVTDSSIVTITAAGSSGHSVGQTMPYSTFRGSATVTVVPFDQSTNARHPTQSNASNRPRITNAGSNETISNGKMGIRFVSASSNFLSVPNVGTGSAIWGNLVLRSMAVPPASANGPALGDFSSITDAMHWPWTDSVMYDGFGRSIRNTIGTLSPNLSNVMVMSIVSDATRYELFTNGVSRFSNTGGAVNIHTGSHRIASGSLNATTYFWDGIVGEAIVFLASPSASVRQALELNQKAFFGTP